MYSWNIMHHSYIYSIKLNGCLEFSVYLLVLFSLYRFVNLRFTVEEGATLVFDMPITRFGPNSGVRVPNKKTLNQLVAASLRLMQRTNPLYYAVSVEGIKAPPLLIPCPVESFPSPVGFFPRGPLRVGVLLILHARVHSLAEDLEERLPPGQQGHLEVLL